MAYRIVKGARTSLGHVRSVEGECIGRIEVGEYEIADRDHRRSRAAAREGEGTLAAAAARLSVDQLRA